MSLHQYIISYRLSVAKTLLLAGEKSILDVAVKSGFQDPSSFSYTFKKHIGKSSLEFRKNSYKTI